MGWKVDGKSFGKISKFRATSIIERDVDKKHSSPIAPSTEATPTDPMNKTRSQAIFDTLGCCFQQSLCWWRKSSFSPAHASPFKAIRSSFWLPSLLVKK